MYGIWKSFHAILVALINQSLCFLTFLYAAFLRWKIIIAPYQRGHTIACQYTDVIYKWELKSLIIFLSSFSGYFEAWYLQGI